MQFDDDLMSFLRVCFEFGAAVRLHDLVKHKHASTYLNATTHLNTSIACCKSHRALLLPVRSLTVFHQSINHLYFPAQRLGVPGPGVQHTGAVLACASANSACSAVQFV